MELLLWVLYGVIPAVAAMLVGVGVGGPRWLGLALTVAICVPFGMASGWPDWPWRLDAANGAARPWLWWLFLGGGLIGIGYDLRLLPRALLIVGELALVAFLPWFVSAPLRASFTFEGCVAFLGGGWAVLAALWWTLRSAARAYPGMTVPFAMTIVLTTDAWLLARRTGGADWQLAGVAAVALGFAVLTTAWRRPFVCGTGGSLCIVLAHAGLLWCGRSERELLRLPFVLALLAPLPLWLVVSRWFAESRTTGALLAVCGVAGACGLVAVVA